MTCSVGSQTFYPYELSLIRARALKMLVARKVGLATHVKYMSRTSNAYIYAHSLSCKAGTYPSMSKNCRPS